jgi:hypothetical protein
MRQRCPRESKAAYEPGHAARNKTTLRVVVK